ncbi:MAG: NAD(P)/FAD-dependent oxidoreductase [Betaproteobacteria bacterium]
MEHVDTVVIGAGVVGLAVARALALAGREVIVLEAENAIGTHTSSRNSEVIHAGIYYPKGSLKAQLCVAGRQQLYEYCSDHGVGHQRCGKLIVATSESQIADLDKIRAAAHANGVADVAPIALERVREMEPAVRCVAALHSPSTGIIDSHGLMLAYQGDAEAHGAMLAFTGTVTSGQITADGIVLEVGGEQPMQLLAKQVVNSAGLHAPALAASLAGFPRDHVPPSYLCKGNYYSLTGRAPFSRLIYPIPEAAGLGVHVTLDMAGQARFGPDVEWIDNIDYSVDPQRADKFYAAIRTYWPELKDGALSPGYCGIRPKISGPKEAAHDFMIEGPREHGVPGLVNLFGIESPGLTASLAIGGLVAEMLAA